MTINNRQCSITSRIVTIPNSIVGSERGDSLRAVMSPTRHHHHHHHHHHHCVNYSLRISCPRCSRLNSSLTATPGNQAKTKRTCAHNTPFCHTSPPTTPRHHTTTPRANHITTAWSRSSACLKARSCRSDCSGDTSWWCHHSVWWSWRSWPTWALRDVILPPVNHTITVGCRRRGRQKRA